MSLEIQLQETSQDFQKLQVNLAQAVEGRQQLDAQLSENQQVKKEFAQLTPANTVYKLIGPVLVQQDQAEAKGNVVTRIQFIQDEIKRVEGQIKDIEGRQEKKKAEIVQIQTTLRQQQQPTSPV